MAGPSEDKTVAGLRFRREISVGNLITAVGMIVAALLAWGDLTARVAVIGNRVEVIAEHSTSREPHPEAERRISIMETRQQSQNEELIRRMEKIEQEMGVIRQYVNGGSDR